MASIFDKAVTALNKGVANVSVKAKIKTQIETYEAERKQLAELLGMKFYDECVKTGKPPEDPGMANFVAQISSRLSGIKEQHEELQRLEIEAQQAAYGYPQGYPQAPPPGSIQCQCGTVLAEGTRFCSTCGGQLVQDE